MCLKVVPKVRGKGGGISSRVRGVRFPVMGWDVCVSLRWMDTG